MDQLMQLIAGLSIKQRVSIVMAALLAAGGIVALVHWKHEDDFRPLYSAMAPEDAATVVQKLKETGVEYRLGDNGSAVLVPSAKVAEARLALAAAGLPKSGRMGFELFDRANFGATEFVEHINYNRALEGELERSVMRLQEVEQARVHLTLPKDSVFLDQQQPAKASVMVKLRPGAQMSARNVLAVTHLVASAVQGLTPEGVSVVDMDGNLLTRPRRDNGEDAETGTAALEMRQQLERSLVTKISETLDPLLGNSGYRAGASIDCDPTSGDEQAETLDPTHSVMVSSQKTEEGTERAAFGGIPGTASNLPAPAPKAAGGGGTLTRRTEDITYQTSRVVRHTRIPQGVIKRMSLAILVNHTARWEGDGAARHRVLAPPPAETLKTIRDLVAGVTGFNAERGDQLIVEALPFESTLNPEPAPGRPVASRPAPKGPAWLEFWNQHHELLLPIVVAVLMILGLLFAMWRFGTKRKPAVIPASAPETLEFTPAAPQLPGEAGPAGLTELPAGAAYAPLAEGGGNEKTDRVRQLAQRDPTATASVVRLWLRDTEP